MSVARRLLIIFAFVPPVCAGVCGCARCPETQISLEQLVDEYNVNAACVPRLWARAKIQLTLPDERGGTFTWGSTSPLAGANGLLILSKRPNRLGPQDFVLIGRELGGLELFRLGSSVDEGAYYLWYRLGSRGGAWWGRHKFAGAPGIQALPIEPSQLLAVLGVCELPEDFTRLPTVALSMSHDPCAYVLTYIERESTTNRISFKKEIYFRWDDTRMRRPFLVKLFDNSGNRIMIAKLRNYQHIRNPDLQENLPVMPTNIEISWPGKAGRIHIALSEMTTVQKGTAEVFGFRENLPPGISPADIIQVDKAPAAEDPPR